MTTNLQYAPSITFRLNAKLLTFFVSDIIDIVFPFFIFRDIVKRDFVEHYRNMTIKHLTVLEWIMDYCSDVMYLVKVDDDVFVNVFQVLTFVETFQPPGFYCSRSQKSKTLRTGKWKLTFKEYPRKTFPPYCMGYGYVMRASHAKSVYWCSVYR